MSDELDDDFDDDEDGEDEIGAEGNRIVGARARAVAEHVTRNLADDPDAIEIEVEERRNGDVALLVHANPDDMGRLIGRRGRVIQALRQLVRAAGSADGVKANVDIAGVIVAPAAGELEVGRVGRPHGLRGEVSVMFVSNRPERTAPGAVLHAGERELVVASARRHQDRWLVRFEGVDDRGAAERLRGSLLTAAPLGADTPLDEGEFWVHDLIGSSVVDTDGRVLGDVVNVEANPADDLLVLDTGALVPLVFVVERRAATVVVDPPEGLLDL